MPATPYKHTTNAKIENVEPKSHSQSDGTVLVPEPSDDPNDPLVRLLTIQVDC